MARIPEIIRRNPLSQVAPQAPKAGQGWAALADLASVGADFVKPAAADEARQKGEKSVYRDEQGNLKVDERSLYSGEMGALQNQAAYTAYLSKSTIDINTTMQELAVKYQYDPAGFQEASAAYVKTLDGDPNVPDVLKGDIVRSVEEGASRQFNGLQRQQIDRTYKEADKQSKTARELLLDDYVSLYVEGDEEGAAAKWQEVEQLSRMRADAPYISETPAETEAMLRGARGTAKAARLLRDLDALEGADAISDEQRAELNETLKDPDIAPGTRDKLYRATQGQLKSIDAAGIVKGMTNDNYEAKTIRRESGGRNNAKAATSSAYGPHQFLKGTWRGLVKKYKPAWANGLSDGQLQALRGDRAKSSEMFQHFRRENQAVLRKRNVPINDATEYAAHFFGASDAAKVYTAAPDTPLSALVPAATIKANKFLQGMTARDAQNWAARKMTMKASDIARMQVQVDQIADPEVRRMASQGLSERIEVRRNIESAAASVFEERIATGDVSVTSQEIAENNDLSTDDQIRLTSALDKANEKQDSLSQTVVRMNDPDASFDPLDTSDKNAVNDVFEATVGDAPATSEQGVAAASEIAKRTGIIPKKVANAVRAGVTSNDPATVGSSLETLARLKSDAGGGLTSVTGAKGLNNQLSDFEFYGQFMGRDEAAQRLIDNREKKPKNVTDEAKEMAKKLKISDITDGFDRSVFSTPKVGDERAGAKATPLLTGPQENEMMAEYGTLFKDAYADTGDFDLSQNRALDEMGRIYGTNDVSGNGRVMKFPAQKLYPPVGGTHKWMAPQLVEEVNAALFGDDLEPDGPSAGGFTRRPDRKRVDRSQIELVSDATTAAQAKTGQPASYVVYAMKDGEMQQLPDRFTFDPSQAQSEARQAFEKDRGVALESTSRFRSRLDPDPEFFDNVEKFGRETAEQMQRDKSGITER